MNRRESGIIPSSSFFCFFLVVDYVFRESENVCIFFFLAVIFYLEIQMMNKFGPETKKNFSFPSCT